MRLRHATTTATISGTQWNESHVLAAHALGDITGSVSLTLDNGSVQTGTLTGNVTFTLPTVAAGTTEHLTLILINDATAGRADDGRRSCPSAFAPHHDAVVMR